MELFRRAGDEEGAVAATRALAFVHDSSGDTERARALHEANLGRARELGYLDTEAGTLGSLTTIAIQEGRADDARELARENLLAAQRLRSLRAMAESLVRTADVLARFFGRAETAAALLACFDSLHDRIGVSGAWVGRWNEELRAELRGRLDQATLAEAWERGAKLTVDKAVALALAELEPHS